MNKLFYFVATLFFYCAATLSKHVELSSEKTQMTTGQKSTVAVDRVVTIETASDEEYQQHLKSLTSVQKSTPLGRALAQSKNQFAADSLNMDKTLNLKISQFKDNSGLVYLGGEVSIAELNHYLVQLKHELGEEKFATYRQYQAARDHQSFHVTLINPYEFQTINKDALKSLTHFNVTLHGLGRVENEDKKSYFVVASSSEGQFIRQKLLLKNKDFHVTLGFFPDDIYGVSKGRDTLINK